MVLGTSDVYNLGPIAGAFNVCSCTERNKGWGGNGKMECSPTCWKNSSNSKSGFHYRWDIVVGIFFFSDQD